MYITDLRHFLDPRGAIGPTKGAARAMARFQTDLVAHASSVAGAAPAAPTCFKCKKAEVEASVASDNAVIWICPNCGIEGRTSNWQGTLWDLRDRPENR
jgi:ribosomal protein L37AE/L43A